MSHKNIFRAVDDSWERKECFDHYFNIIKTKYTLNANIDITLLLEERKKRNLKFFPIFLYVIMSAVNSNKEFRMSFSDSQLGFWDYVVPSYTIFHEDDKTFSDLWTEWDPKFSNFYAQVCGDILQYGDVKGLKAREGRPDNFCPISALPWLHYTSFSQDTYSESDLLFPLIKFGKFETENGRTRIPISVFVNHAIADGYHTCKLINDMQDLAKSTSLWMSK